MPRPADRGHHPGPRRRSGHRPPAALRTDSRTAHRGLDSRPRSGSTALKPTAASASSGAPSPSSAGRLSHGHPAALSRWPRCLYHHLILKTPTSTHQPHQPLSALQPRHQRPAFRSARDPNEKPPISDQWGVRKTPPDGQRVRKFHAGIFQPGDRLSMGVVRRRPTDHRPVTRCAAGGGGGRAPSVPGPGQRRP